MFYIWEPTLWRGCTFLPSFYLAILREISVPATLAHKTKTCVKTLKEAQNRDVYGDEIDSELEYNRSIQKTKTWYPFF